MKIGDTIKSGDLEGRLVKIQPKTQDLIVEDIKGKLHVFLRSRSELIAKEAKSSCTSEAS
jgi:hypothetical protein